MPKKFFPKNFRPDVARRISNFIAAQDNLSKVDASRKIAASMKTESGKFVDIEGNPFDPVQIFRRKKSLPKGYEDAVFKYLWSNLNDLALYYVLKHVFEEKVDEIEFLECIAKDKELFEIGKILGSQDSMRASLQSLNNQREKRLLQFLLFTPTEEGSIIHSIMEIDLHNNEENKLPSFVTKEYNASGLISSVVEGFMYEADGFIFAIGKMADRGSLRVSKLKRVSRVRGNQSNQEDGDSLSRHDLIGLRLGGYSNLENPNAHRVYAYEITTTEKFQIIDQFLTKNGSKIAFDKTNTLAHIHFLNSEFKIANYTCKIIIEYLVRHASKHEFGNLDTPSLNKISEMVDKLDSTKP